MKNHKFETFFEVFKQTDVWDTMTKTVENSPWHREANVAVHTQMCIDQYYERFSDRSELQSMIALISLLFHDAGKPAAEEVLEKKDGTGLYRRYAGHELASANTFMECYVTMQELRELLTPLQARAVRWCIEHHLPYDLKDQVKRQGLRNATTAVFQAIGISDETFFDCLRSDAAGRISDNHEQKLDAVEEWVKDFKTIGVYLQLTCARTENQMYILIGPSGSGKSTWVRNKIAELSAPSVIISHDDEKDVFYTQQFPNAVFSSAAERYDAVWAYCAEVGSAQYRVFFEKQVKQKMDMVKSTAANVFIDIVNTSKKYRQQWVDQARRAGISVVAVEFWNDVETLINRQSSRTDKSVPAHAVKQQQGAISCAWLGHEAANVTLVIKNQITSE